MDCFVRLPIDEKVWNDLGRILRTLRSRGLAVPFADALIATVAMGGGLLLWTYDAHFVVIASALPDLRLFDGPRI
ncbi:MAG TPA: hypothetical protein PLL20_04195 [Phycisphaerae bacterium]|nr:hypothetical protein [Phycisphaerae bacterium]HRR85672.1 hypothetical protein [Phycisphaerae bacterium]